MAEQNGVAPLTEAEQAYLNSGGQDAAGLVAQLQPEAGSSATGEVAPKLPEAEPKKTDAPVAAGADGVKPAPVATPAAAAPATEEPEVGEEDIATSDGKGKRRIVDARALRESRKQRKELEVKLEEERNARAKDNEARAVVNERLRLLTEAVATPAAETGAPAQPAKVPDPNDDIFGFAAHLGKQVEELNGKIGQITEQTAGDRQQAAGERQQASVLRNYHQDAAAFTEKTPDFRDAYNHLFGLRKRQLEIQGYTPEQVNRFIFDEEMNHIQRSFQAGRSPTQGLYELAKLAGYVTKAPAAAATAQPAAVPAANGQNANGQAANGQVITPPAAAAPAAPQPAANVTAEIERIQNGQRAARSLSNGAGGGGDELSIEALATMPMDEFAKLVRSKQGAVERAMGRSN